MELIRDETGAQRLIGYVLDVGQGDGCARCRLDTDERHLNRQGILHGGIAATLLDNAMGATGSLSVDPSGRHPFTTLALTVNYLSPGRLGRIEATGRITGGGRTTLFIEGELRHEDGALIATATGVFRKSRQEP
ncbi:MAG: PaaI family thioesterase [Alphaproteobacteria bacterium]|nr:PaaI family thioesterase [Alphaproteobacteria bacterium]